MKEWQARPSSEGKSRVWPGLSLSPSATPMLNMRRSLRCVCVCVCVFVFVYVHVYVYACVYVCVHITYKYIMHTYYIQIYHAYIL
jgi:hypothetical protein